ncbi:prolyl oligopeptidase family serine peptidase [Chitinophaga sp. MM2321]|uniref:alpha/beta hydrolase family protein n=1 Tax=Chitinophaga sp. MM2321 TaxID=3137178 RepID=UPI0032D59D63
MNNEHKRYENNKKINMAESKQIGIYTYQGILSLWTKICFIMIPLLCITQIGSSQSLKTDVRHMRTDNGVDFGIWGYVEGKSPQPILVILSNTIDETLNSEYFRQCGTRLAKEYGWLCVSLDIPYHGKRIRKAAESGLTGWAVAAKRGEDFVKDNNRSVSEILKFLIKKGYADPDKIAVCGTSRGGYLALQFAASEPGVKAVAAFAPVTDLLALKEFSGFSATDIPASLNLDNKINSLSQKGVWIVIGDRDERVDTDKAIELARKISKASSKSDVELNVMTEPKGHSTPKGSVDRAVKWITDRYGMTR